MPGYPASSTAMSLLDSYNRRRAERELQRGQRQAQLWQGVGSAITGSIGQALQWAQNAPYREASAAQAELMQRNAQYAQEVDDRHAFMASGQPGPPTPFQTAGAQRIYGQDQDRATAYAMNDQRLQQGQRALDVQGERDALASGQSAAATYPENQDWQLQRQAGQEDLTARQRLNQRNEMADTSADVDRMLRSFATRVYNGDWQSVRKEILDSVAGIDEDQAVMVDRELPQEMDPEQMLLLSKTVPAFSVLGEIVQMSNQNPSVDHKEFAQIGKPIGEVVNALYEATSSNPGIPEAEAWDRTAASIMAIHGGDPIVAAHILAAESTGDPVVYFKALSSGRTGPLEVVDSDASTTGGQAGALVRTHGGMKFEPYPMGTGTESALSRGQRWREHAPGPFEPLQAPEGTQIPAEQRQAHQAGHAQDLSDAADAYLAGGGQPMIPRQGMIVITDLRRGTKSVQDAAQLSEEDRLIFQTQMLAGEIVVSSGLRNPEVSGPSLTPDLDLYMRGVSPRQSGQSAR